MSKKESLQKKIDILDRKAKFFQNLLLALLSGITAVIFGISQNRINNLGIFFVIVGIILTALIMVYLKKY